MMRLKPLNRSGDIKGGITLYKEKFVQKKVDISLKNGIIILDFLLEAKDVKTASILCDALMASYPDTVLLQHYREQIKKLSIHLRTVQ